MTPFPLLKLVNRWLLFSLNSFDYNIQFPYEMKKSTKLAFLDVLLHRNNENKTFLTKKQNKQTNFMAPFDGWGATLSQS